MSRLRAYAARFDPRLMVALAAICGVMAWRASWPGLAVYILFSGAMAVSLRHNLAAGTGALKASMYFVLFWAGLKFASDMFSPLDATTAAESAVMLGARLLVLMLTGLALAMAASARRLGRALAWYLRPVMGDKSWQAALGLALMVHFLPMTWESATGLTATLKRRVPDMGWFRRGQVLAQSLIRVLAQSTWRQTLAVACRGLDDPGPWRMNRAPGMGQIFLALLLGLGFVLLGLIRF